MTENKIKWVRCRFRTRSVNDYRPLKDMRQIGPWWCTGTSCDGDYVTIVCYLPPMVSVYEFWDDAYDIDATIEAEIKYTDRFPRPEWLEVE